MSVIPPSTPGLWKKIPKFLMDPLGPLAIRWSYLPRVAPWLVKYLRAGWTEAKVEATARAIRPLLDGSPRSTGRWPSARGRAADRAARADVCV